MAEISDREYQLIMTAINSNASAVQGLTAVVNDLNITLAREYLTRDEDVKNDEERIARVFLYVRERETTLRDESDTQAKAAREIHENINARVTLLAWVVGIEFTFILGLAITHLTR